MNPETKNLLLCAWRENRLAAVHIDMQCHYAPDVYRLFKKVGELASGLRQSGVPNIWVALGAKERDILPQKVTVRDQPGLNQPDDFLLSNWVGAQADESLIIKRTYSAFEAYPAGASVPLKQHLNDMGKDTILIGGIYGNLCVAETIREGLLQNHYHFVAIRDAISFHGDYYLQSIGGVFRSYPEIRQRVHETETAEVLKILAPSARL